MSMASHFLLRIFSVYHFYSSPAHFHVHVQALAELRWYYCGGGYSDLVDFYVTDANSMAGFFFDEAPNVSDTEWRRTRRRRCSFWPLRLRRCSSSSQLKSQRPRLTSRLVLNSSFKQINSPQGDVFAYISSTGNYNVIVDEDFKRVSEMQDEIVDLIMDMIRRKYDWSKHEWAYKETVQPFVDSSEEDGSDKEEAGETSETGMEEEIETTH
ncbi:hypothetical protein Bca52824_011497 [Brassica carinata]|uniref:Uncharacterized protein n=1 Tax=Brassica carinata TaxID=52824 RepID=A0A8X7WDL0_BRACI|nr:hypothetical protein Bca52824_011497 [Brassica carinata]